MKEAYTQDSLFRKMRGRFCEAVACHMLLKRNYKIIKKNYHTNAGEVDIIVSKGRFVIFVEVKSWNTYDAIALERVITEAKLHRMRQCALLFFLNEKSLVKACTRMYMRFDIILIKILCYEMVHYKGV